LIYKFNECVQSEIRSGTKKNKNKKLKLAVNYGLPNTEKKEKIPGTRLII